MPWLRLHATPAFVNSETGVVAEVVVFETLYRFRIAGKLLAGTGYAVQQDALEYLEQILQGYTIP